MSETKTWEQEWQEVHGHGLDDGTDEELQPILGRRLDEELARRLDMFDLNPVNSTWVGRVVEQVLHELLHSFAAELADRFLAEGVAAGRLREVEPGVYERVEA